jgi:hypothetical protein
MRGAEFVVSDEYADVVVGEIYDSSEKAYAYVADAIPSIEDLRAEFCAEFRRAAPGCEVDPKPLTGRALFAEVPAGSGEQVVCHRRKLYARARVDMERVHAGGVGLVEHVRGACLLAARKMAMGVASQTNLPLGGKATSVRFTGGGPLHWPGHSYTGRPRVALEHSRDSVILILASYYALVPAGATVIEPEPAP